MVARSFFTRLALWVVAFGSLPTVIIACSLAGPEFSAGPAATAGFDSGPDVDNSAIWLPTDPSSAPDAGDATLYAATGDATMETSLGVVIAEGGLGGDEAGEAFEAGSCPGAELACSGRCVSPTDVHTCGSCGNDCTLLPNVSADGLACDQGRCVYNCASGYSDCASAGTGCRTSVQTTSNCGACGANCPPSAPLCMQGDAGTYGCGLVCLSGTVNCGGTCTALAADPKNCGACDAGCQAPTLGQATCSGGSCSMSCSGSRSLCGGACVDEASDPSHCGACGTTCANATPLCLNGNCVACMPGATQCSGNGALRTCGTTGQWGNAVTCTEPTPGCSQGACVCPTGNAIISGLCCPNGQGVCGGACVDEQKDASNCGSCGHDCQGGGCSGGQCQPVILALLPSQSIPYEIVVDSTNVYWTNQGLGAPSPPNGSVMKCAIGGCAQAPTTLAANQSVATGIAVNATNVYWGGNGNLMRAGLDGSNLTTLVFSVVAVSIALDSTSVYWSDNATSAPVTKAALDGSNLTILANSQGGPVAIAVNSSGLFWVNEFGGTITTCATAGCGGAPTTLVSGQTSPLDIALTPTNIYWIDDALSTGTVMRAALDGTNVTTLVSGLVAPNTFAVDSSGIYWWTGALMKAALDGSGVTTIATTPSGFYVNDIALDARAVYWTLSSGSGSGQVAKVAK